MYIHHTQVQRNTLQTPTNITMPPRHAFHERTWSISFNKVRCRVMLVFIASSSLRRVSSIETGGYMRDPPDMAVAAAPRRPSRSSRSSRSCRRLRRRSEAAPACLPPPPFASFAFAASFADRRWDALKSSHASPFGCGVPHVAHVSTCGRFKTVHAEHIHFADSVGAMYGRCATAGVGGGTRRGCG